MTNKNLKAITLLIILTLTGRISAINVVKKNLAELQSNESHYLQYARGSVQGFNINTPNPDVTHIKMTGFYNLPHFYDPNYYLLYSNTVELGNENGETNLDLWKLIQEQATEEFIYVPEITQIFYILDTKETIVEYKRALGSIFNKFFQANDYLPQTDRDLMNFLNDNNNRKFTYAQMVKILGIIEDLGYQDCSLGPDTFQYLQFGTSFGAQGNITVDKSDVDNYYLLYTGFDSLRKIENGCPKEISQDPFQAAFADSGWIKSDFESGEYNKISVFSLGVYLFTLESYYLSCLYESNFAVRPVKKTNIALRKNLTQEPTQLEGQMQKLFFDRAPSVLKRNEKFQGYVEEIVGVNENDLLFKAFRLRKPISNSPIYFIMRAIMEILGFYNRSQEKPFELSEIKSALLYLVYIFQRDTVLQYETWANVFVKFQDEYKMNGIFRFNQNDRAFWDIVIKMINESPSNRPSFKEAFAEMNENLEQFADLTNLLNEEWKKTNNMERERDIIRRLVLV